MITQSQGRLAGDTLASFRLSLKKSFLYRAQAVYYGRLSLNCLYLFFWLFSTLSADSIFPDSQWDLALILIAFFYTIICYQYKNHKDLGRWLHFLTLIADLFLHLFFTRTSGFLLSPLMAIHPFLAAAVLLLFHNPLLMLAPLFMLPLATVLCFLTSETVDLTSIFFSLAMNCGLDALVIFFIHLSHSKEHKLLRSMVSMEKKLKELALIKERQRISREFHDGVGAKMASIVMQCDYLQQTDPKDQNLSDELIAIKESAIESIDDMRRSIAFLHGDFDIADQIELLMAKTASRHRLSITGQGIDVLRFLSPEQQIACCRIIQEALTNALKHAQASKIAINAIIAHKAIRVSIQDDGVGFETAVKKKHHFGIKNMIDRARLMNGDLTCTSNLNAGTKISLEIPMT